MQNAIIALKLRGGGGLAPNSLIYTGFMSCIHFKEGLCSW